MWFYDTIDLAPFLRAGENTIAVHVLRLYYGTRFGTSFPRLPFGGLRIQHIEDELPSGDEIVDNNDTNASQDQGFSINTDETWETAIDLTTALPVHKEDLFLHIYEAVDKTKASQLNWIPAKQHKVFTAFGLLLPWRLSPRMIPYARLQPAAFQQVHNTRSSLSKSAWDEALLGNSLIILPAGTTHHIEIEAFHHLTAFLDFKFRQPRTAGSKFKVTYSECYEDPPAANNVHIKGDRRDTTKQLLGPNDTFIFGGTALSRRERRATYHAEGDHIEVFSPFHFRTFRFLALDIEVAPDSDLTFLGCTITRTSYPLDVKAHFTASPHAQPDFPVQRLWDTSLLTLENCMHDCYEDCPFYEQLQYAMDTRSSILFTYYISGDDRLARQAIRQLANSFEPGLGLTASRAPCQHLQIIPHFSLFWILMVVDHFEHYADSDFVAQFVPICNAVLETFKRRIEPQYGLIKVYPTEEFWDFVDWTQEWQPFGIPPAGRRSGFQTFTNSLYAYTLQRMIYLYQKQGETNLANQYEAQSKAIVNAIKKYCYDGNFELFTDGLSANIDSKSDFSLHNQVWAVLCGAKTGDKAVQLLSRALSNDSLTSPSIAMSFYTLRAMSIAGNDIYNHHFFNFWQPWLDQLSQNVTTWVEDPVSQRSDCHAWGSAPLHEFLAEVVGVTPLEPGWKKIAFRPRLELFKNVDAKVALHVKDVGSVVAHVVWSSTKEGGFNVAFELKAQSNSAVDVPVVVALPSKQDEVLASSFYLKDVRIGGKEGSKELDV